MERLQDFKNKGKSGSLRTQRRDSAFELRKQKRFEQLQKRRNVGDSEENDENSHVSGNHGNISSGAIIPVANAKPQITMQALKPALEVIKSSNDFEEAFKATKICRQVLSKDKFTKKATHEVIKSGVIPRLVEFLSVPHDELRYEAAWALTNVSSGSSSDTRAVASAGAIPQLVNMLTSEAEHVREQAIWCLGNIAGDGSELRDVVIGSGILQPLASNIINQNTLSMLQTATWVLSNLCRGKNPEPNFDIMRDAIPIFLELTSHEDDSIKSDAMWGLSYLSDGENHKIEAIIAGGCVPTFIQLLEHRSTKILLPAIRCIGNIVTGTNEQTQVAIDAGCLSHFVQLLQHPKENVRKETCWALSNIAAGTISQITALIDANLIPLILHCLGNGEFKTRKEACWAVTNLTNNGTDEQIWYLITQGCIQPLVDLLLVPDITTLENTLTTLGNLLRVSDKNHGTENEVAVWIEEVGGLDNIEMLQHHENEKIYELALNLMDTYFSEEAEDDALVPQQTSGGFMLSASVAGNNFEL